MTNSAIFPRLRLVSLLGIGVFVNCIRQIEFLLLLTACSAISLIILYQIKNGNIRLLFQRWLKLNCFSLLIWLTLSWKMTENGTQWNQIGIELATLISLRMNIIFFVTLGLLFNITDTILIQTLATLPIPNKLIHLFILTSRYIQILGEIDQKIEIAMKARGFQPQCNWRTIVISSQRVALLLIHAMIKAEKAEIALKARGFLFGKNNHNVVKKKNKR